MPKKANVRKNAQKKRESLWRKCYGLCFYCNVQTHCVSILIRVYGYNNVLSHKRLNREDRVKGIIKYRRPDSSKWIEVQQATIDHTLELDHPDCNKQEHLRLACTRCNQRLSREKTVRLRGKSV